MPRHLGRRNIAARRRQTEWFDTHFNLQLAVNTLTFSSLTQPLDDEKKGMTLLRTLADLTFEVETVAAAQTVAFGMLLVTDEAVASVAVPGPQDVNDQPGWLFRHNFVLRTSVIGDGGAIRTFTRDLRGKRKYLGADQVWVIAFETGGTGGATVRVGGVIRQLMAKA